MIASDWPTLRRCLESGWPERDREPIDDAAYFALLKPYALPDLMAAVQALTAVARFTPKAGEIVRQVERDRDRRAEWERAEMERFEARIVAGGGLGRFLSDEQRKAVDADIKRTHGWSYPQLLAAAKTARAAA